MKKKKLACRLLAVWLSALTLVSQVTPVSAKENAVSSDAMSAYEVEADGDSGDKATPREVGTTWEPQKAENPDGRAAPEAQKEESPADSGNLAAAGEERSENPDEAAVPGEQEAERSDDPAVSGTQKPDSRDGVTESGRQTADSQNTAGDTKTDSLSAGMPVQKEESAGPDAETQSEASVSPKSGETDLTEEEICAYADALMERSDLEGGAGPELSDPRDAEIWQRYLALLQEKRAGSHSGKALRRAPQGGRYPASVDLHNYVTDRGYQARIGFLTTADYDNGNTVHGGSYNYDPETGKALYCVDQHWDGAVGNRSRNWPEVEDGSDLGGSADNRILFTYILSHGLNTAGKRAADAAYRSSVADPFGASCLDYAITQAALWDVLAGQTREGHSPGSGKPRRGFDIQSDQVGVKAGRGCETIGWTDGAMTEALAKAEQLAEDARRYLRTYPDGEAPSVTLTPEGGTQLSFRAETGTYESGWIRIDYGGIPHNITVKIADGAGQVVWDETKSRFRITIPCAAVSTASVTAAASADFTIYDSVNYRWEDPSVQRFALLIGPSETSDDAQLSLTLPVRQLRLKKEAADPGLCAGNACYSLSGAEYGVYRSREDAEADRKRVETLVTGNTGETEAVSLPAGVYYVKEQKASAGYSLDTAVHRADLLNEETEQVKTLRVQEKPVFADLLAVIQKTDGGLFEKNGRAGTEGNQLLGGAVIRVAYYDNAEDRYTGRPVRSWYFQTSEDGEIRPTSDRPAAGYASDTFYTDGSGARRFPVGTYTFEEVEASPGFLKNDGVFLHGTVSQTEPGADRAAFVTDNKVSSSAMLAHDAKEDAKYYLKQVNPVRIGIRIQKQDKDTGSADAQGDVADFSGIRYLVTNRSSHAVLYEDRLYQPGASFALVSSTSGGTATGAVLPVGTYEIREDTSGGTNTGYLRDDRTVHTLDIRPDGEKGFAVKEDGKQSQYTPEKLNGKVFAFSFRDTVKKGGISGLKYDAERKKAVPQGSASLAGAEIRVINASEHAVFIRDNGAQNVTYYTGLIPTAGRQLGPDPTRDELAGASASAVLSLKTDQNGVFRSGSLDLPYGTYYLYEAVSSKGYDINRDWVVKCEVRENGNVYAFDRVGGVRELTNGSRAGGATLPEPVKRGDLRLVKLDTDGTVKAHIPFLIQNLKTDGEGAIVYENGAPVVLEQHVCVTDENGVLDTKARTKPAKEAQAELDAMAKNGVFADSGKLAGFAGQGVWFGESEPEQGRGSLIYGKYRVVELSCRDNREKGENLTISDLIMVGENPDHGGIHTVYLVDRHIGVTSEAYAEELSTNTKKSHTVRVGRNVPVTETLHLTNLDAGRTYYIYACATDSGDRDRICGSNYAGWARTGAIPGETLTEEEAAQLTKLTAPSGDASGTKTVEADAAVTFYLNTDALRGKTLYVEDVIYEEIGGNLVAVQSHTRDSAVSDDARSGRESTAYADAFRTSQVLYVPDIRTAASDQKTGDRVGTVCGGSRILDTVVYSNLAPDVLYQIEEKVVFANAFTDADGVRHEAGEAVPADHTGAARVNTRRIWETGENVLSGTVKMDAFEVDTAEYAGATLAVIEEIYRVDLLGRHLDTYPIVSHNPLLEMYEEATGRWTAGQDEQQMIHYPGIRTQAGDVRTGNHCGAAVVNAEIIDRVQLDNLIPGARYTVKGRLIYRNNFTDAEGAFHARGETVALTDGTENEVTAEYQASGRSGSLVMHFHLDASDLPGCSIAVAESLYHSADAGKQEAVRVAAHENLDDTSQLIHYPEEPSEQVISEKPTVSSRPAVPESTSGPSEPAVESRGAETGDRGPGLYLCLAAAGLTGTFYGVYSRKRKKKEHR